MPRSYQPRSDTMKMVSVALHMYTPWWLDNKKLHFARGYHIEYWAEWANLLMAQEWEWHIPMRGRCNRWIWQPSPNGGYGEGLKKDYARFMAPPGMSGGVKVFVKYDNVLRKSTQMWSIKFGILSWDSLQLDGSRKSFRRSICNDTFEEILTPFRRKTLLGTKLARIQIPELGCSWNELIHEVGTSNGKWWQKLRFVIQTHRYTIVRMYFVVECWNFRFSSRLRIDVEIFGFELENFRFYYWAIETKKY